jgi:antitoxin component HigA of HigAB toxin-antitoxin module
MVTEAEYQQALAEIRHLVEDEPDRASREGIAWMCSQTSSRLMRRPVEAEPDRCGQPVVSSAA